MKEKYFVKRILAAVLVLVSVVDLFGMDGMAMPHSDLKHEFSADAESDNMQMEATNSVGGLITNTITSVEEVQNEDYYVTDLMISGNTATVTYQTTVDSDIVVAIYTEDRLQMLASGTASVTANEATTTVTIETEEMPEYFVAAAYLLDRESHQPLCSEYTTNYYTQEFQEFLGKTTADFDESEILNLDEDSTTNFAVYQDSTVRFAAEEGRNALIFADETNRTYRIGQADDTVKTLQEGSAFAYQYSETDILIGIVSAITVDGDTVSITVRDDTELQDIFQHVKIEGASTDADVTVDNSNLEEGITYVEEEVNPNGISLEGIGEVSYHKYLINKSYEAADDELFGGIEINASVSLNLSVDVGIKAKVKVYVSMGWQAVEATIEASGSVSGDISGKIGVRCPLGEFGVSPVAGVYIMFTPEVIFEAKGSIDFAAEFQMIAGFGWDNENGFTNKSVPPKVSKCQLEVEASLYLGFSLEPKIKIVSDEIASAGIIAEAGIEITGSMKTSVQSGSSIHTCQFCIDGSVLGKITLSAEVKLVNNIQLKADIINISLHIFDYYYSLDHHEYGMGTCPYFEYKICVRVQDRYENPIPEIAVTGTGLEEDPVTDEKGQASFYLSNGEYDLEAVLGSQSAKKKMYVENEARSVTLVLKSNPGGIGGNTGDTILAAGTCGEDISWLLNGAGILSISGTGAMTNYTNNNAPWFNFRYDITEVCIDENITAIGDRAFADCFELSEISIPMNVTNIGNYAFGNCKSLTKIHFDGNAPGMEENCFSGVTAVAEYHRGNDTWAEEVMQNYGGNITWEEYVIAVENGTCGENLTWVLDDTGTLIISGTGYMTNWSSFNHSPWYGRQDITSLVIEDGVESIGDYAFCNCSGLTGHLVIGNGVIIIGKYAFCGCSSLAGDLIIPSNVTVIGEWAFYKCNGFTGDLLIPDSVLKISEAAFYKCNNISDILVSTNNPNYCSNDKLLYNKECSSVIFCSRRKTGYLEIKDTVTTINSYAFSDCNGLTGELTIPNSVITIGRYAFYGCNGLTGDLIIPDNVTVIGERAFYGCGSLTGNLTIGNNVKSIGDYAFWDCSGLIGNLTLGNSVTSIGGAAFYNCSGLTGNLIIPDGVTFIGMRAFYNCRHLTGNLIIPNSVMELDVGVFERCSGLTGNLIIPDSVTSIRGSVFSGCSGLTGNLIIPDSVTYIGDRAFSGCSGLTGNLIIPGSVTYIGDSAFSGCSGLTGNLIIPDSIKNIEGGVFRDCSGFAGELIIPDSIIRIGNSAFYNCRSLTGNLVIPDSVIYIGSSAFYNCRGFKGNLTIGNSVTDIGRLAFSECSGFTGELTIGNNVKEIGDFAFNNCSGLTGNLTIGNSVTSIGSSAFYNCRSLTGNLVIPDSIVSIGSSAFYNCRGFKGGLTIGNGVTNIGSYTFYYCDLTGNLVIPDSVTNIGEYAFYYCNSLTGELVIPNSVTNIEKYAFGNCSGFTGELRIGNSVGGIGEGAFSGCSGLTGNLKIPESVMSIGYGAFALCTNITTIYFKGDAPIFESDVFRNIIAVSYYPLNNATWTEDMMQNYGGTLTWEAWDVSEGIPESDYLKSSDEDVGEIESITISDSVIKEISKLEATISNEQVEMKSSLSDEQWEDKAILMEETDSFVLKDITEPVLFVSERAEEAKYDYYSEFQPQFLKNKGEAIPLMEYPGEVVSDSGQQIASFTGLVADEYYIFLVVKDAEVDNILDADNLLYIAQTNADEEGNAVFTYIPRENSGNAVVRVYGMSNKNIIDTEITTTNLVYDGTVQFPMVAVTYDGTVLEEDVDYTLSGDLYAVNRGTYTLTVSGKINYAGSVDVTYQVVFPEMPFTDVGESKWYYDTVNETYVLGLMTGTTPTTFAPNSPMTRAMATAVIYRISGSPAIEYESIFSDVADGKYYSKCVTWAAKNKIVNGYTEDNTFRPNANVTREQMAVILYNYAKFRGLDVSVQADLSSFHDVSQISSYARTAMSWAVGNKLMSGTLEGNLNPKSEATRAECAKMLLQTYKLIDENQ